MKNRKRILNLFFLISLLLTSLSIPTSVKAIENESWEFGFTGSVEEWTAPYSGKYKLEVWGAQGGPSAMAGANGGYFAVEIPLLKDEKIYIACGEKGTTNGKGGWNGGGNATQGGSGGGATSITTINRGELKNFAGHKEEVLLVAGGGGGSYESMLSNQWLSCSCSQDSEGNHSRTGNEYLVPGSGGGLYGVHADSVEISYDGYNHKLFGPHSPIPEGGNNASGYAFGQGESGCSGAGGGWYGGYAGKNFHSSSAGGSGYAIETEFNFDFDYGVNENDGKAKITYEGNIQRTIALSMGDCGTYNGETTAKLTCTMGEVVTLNEIKTKEGYKFISWIDYYENEYPNQFIMGKENLELKALFSAPLNITTKKTGDNSISIYMQQQDNINKYYKVLQSKDGVNYYDAALAADVNGGKPTKNRAYNVGNYIYKAPISGEYKIRLYGAKGGDCLISSSQYSSYGGKGAFTEGTIFLNKGDTLYVNIGNMGYTTGVYTAINQVVPGYGGQASDIRINTNDVSNRIMVAAGGGGAYSGAFDPCSGGDGGTLTSAQTKTHTWTTDYYGTQFYLSATQTNHGYFYIRGYGYTTSGHAFTGNLNYINAPNIIKNGYGLSSSRSGGQGYYNGMAVFLIDGRGVTTASGSGGSSYISGYTGCVPEVHASGYKFYDATMTAGVRNAAGFGYIDILTDLNVYEDHMDNIWFYDTKAPNAPSNGIYNSVDNNIIITWQNNGDNGDKYYHKVESYNKKNDELLNTSNVIEEYLETGVKGFHYYIDSNPAGTVTKSHTFVEDAQIQIPTSTSVRYLHVVAVDGAGNISDTYTMEIPSVAKYVVNHYAQNEDGSYTLVKTEEKMGQIGSTVTPDVILQTGRDNPPAQSIIITADGKAHVDYYYDVTRFDVSGIISWNDHENLYGTRPNDIGVTIYRDGEYFDYITVPAADTVNKYQFPALQKYNLETGCEFEYAVEQDVAYSQAALENTEDKYTTIKKGFDFYNGIRNTERPVEPGYPDEPDEPDEPENPDDKGLYVEGDIYWDDNDDSLGFRPSQTTITLYQKGEDGEWKVFGDPIVVDAKNDNHYIFDWLPKYWYDENDVPTAYEYKVEETFTSWYVEDGEIKNIYTIVPDTPKDCDFTNLFNFPDKPIIPVNEYTNTIIVKTNTDEQVRIILKPLELFIYNDYSVSYGDLTGNDIPVMTDKTGTSVKDLPGTRYEVILDSPDYTLEDIKLSLAENMELEKIDDKWYVTIKNIPEEIIGTLEVELSPKENFYQDRQTEIHELLCCKNKHAKIIKAYGDRDI